MRSFGNSPSRIVQKRRPSRYRVMLTLPSTITIPQLRVSWLLGVHFKHEWATLFTTAPTSLEEIARVYGASKNRRLPTFQWGLDRPELNASGEVEHTTTTGRLSWTIRKDGVVRLMVTRKSGALLTVVFDGNTLVSVRRHAPGGAIEPRHIEAIEEVLAVLLVKYVPEIRKGVARTTVLKVLPFLTGEESDAVTGHWAGKRASMHCDPEAPLEQRQSVYEMASELAIKVARRLRMQNSQASV